MRTPPGTRSAAFAGRRMTHRVPQMRHCVSKQMSRSVQLQLTQELGCGRRRASKFCKKSHDASSLLDPAVLKRGANLIETRIAQ